MGEVWAYNDTMNITLQDMLLMTRGPKHSSKGVLIPLTVIFVFMLLIGVLGNVAIWKKIISNSALNTATKYYLFSLAISHLMLLHICLPTQLKVCWEQYPWKFGVMFCKFHAFVCELSSCSSVLGIVAFSMERYLVIMQDMCHHVHSNAISGLRHGINVIALLWIVSLIGAIPFGVFTTVSYIDFPPESNQIVPESAYCGMFEHNIPSHWPVYELSCLMFFLIPMFVIIFLYVKIELKITVTSVEEDVDDNVHGEADQSQARKSIIRMIFAVVIIFLVCQMPLHFQRLLQVYGKISTQNRQIKEWSNYITGSLRYFATIVNLILYYLLSHCGNNIEPNSSLSATVMEQRQCQQTGSTSPVEISTIEEIMIIIAPTPEGRSRIYRKVITSSDPGPCAADLERGGI